MPPRGQPLSKCSPSVKKVDDGYFMMIPEAAGYPQSRVKLPKDAPQRDEVPKGKLG